MWSSAAPARGDGAQAQRSRRQDRLDERPSRRLVHRIQRRPRRERLGRLRRLLAARPRPSSARRPRCRSGSTSCAWRSRACRSSRSTCRTGIATARIDPETGQLARRRCRAQHARSAQSEDVARLAAQPPQNSSTREREAKTCSKQECLRHRLNRLAVRHDDSMPNRTSTPATPRPARHELRARIAVEAARLISRRRLARLPVGQAQGGRTTRHRRRRRAAEKRRNRRRAAGAPAPVPAEISRECCRPARNRARSDALLRAFRAAPGRRRARRHGRRALGRVPASVQRRSRCDRIACSCRSVAFRTRSTPGACASTRDTPCRRAASCYSARTTQRSTSPCCRTIACARRRSTASTISRCAARLWRRLEQARSRGEVAATE